MAVTASDEERDVCHQAFEVFGVNLQLQIAMEECGELIVAISHFLRSREDSAYALAEEIADVELVCASLRELVSGNWWDVDAIKAEKWQRLRERIAAARVKREGAEVA